MKITEKELKDLIKEVILESHSKADEEKLKKMAKKLRSSSKMHGQQSKDLKGSSELHAKQADELEDIVDRSDDEELKEGEEQVTENLNCGCGNDPCVTFGIISIEEARKIVQEEIQADLDEQAGTFVTKGMARRANQPLKIAKKMMSMSDETEDEAAKKVRRHLMKTFPSMSADDINNIIKKAKS